MSPCAWNPILWTAVYTTCSEVDLKGSASVEQPGFWGGQMVTPSPESDGCLWQDSYVAVEGSYQNNPESFYHRPSLSGHPWLLQQPCEFLFGRWRCHQAACLWTWCALALIIQWSQNHCAVCVCGLCSCHSQGVFHLRSEGQLSDSLDKLPGTGQVLCAPGGGR